MLGYEDRQRYSIPRFRPSMWVGRTQPSGERAREQHHAGKSKSDAVRSIDDGGCPGDG